MHAISIQKEQPISKGEEVEDAENPHIGINISSVQFTDAEWHIKTIHV